MNSSGTWNPFEWTRTPPSEVSVTMQVEWGRPVIELDLGQAGNTLARGSAVFGQHARLHAARQGIIR